MLKPAPGQADASPCMTDLSLQDCLGDWETRRLLALESYRVLDTPPEQAFDDLVLLAASHFNVPTALISFVDKRRQWFKAKLNFEASQTSRELSFCQHTIVDHQNILLIADTHRDPRFTDHPAARASPAIRFYAGAPLVSPDKYVLGAICIVDYVPRHDISRDALQVLSALSRQVMAQLEFRRTVALLHEEWRTRKQLESRVARLSWLDEQTGLPKSAIFRRRLRQTIAAPLVEDHDLFAIEITPEHVVREAGDDGLENSLLLVSAERLRSALRIQDSLSHISSGLFLALSERRPRGPSPKRLKKALDAPIFLGEERYFTSSRVGVLHFRPSDYVEAEDAVRDVKLALKAARTSPDGIAVFNKTERAEHLSRLALRRQLCRSLEEKNIPLAYQPICDAFSGHVLAYEALLRWSRPNGEALPAIATLQIAEEAGISIALGKVILRKACVEAASWATSANKVQMNVNVSPAQIGEPGFNQFVRSVLIECGLDAERLCLEITESTLMENRDDALRNINDLRSLGVKVALDDFGTGYSSLSYLRRIPIDAIKIDRSFISGNDGNAKDESIADIEILRMIVSLANSLCLDVTAEGVETTAQLDLVREAGCHRVQGFLVGRPELREHGRPERPGLSC